MISPPLSVCSIATAATALQRCMLDVSFDSPDEIFDAAKREGWNPVFERIEDVESLSKERIFDLMFDGRPLPSAPVFIFVDALLPTSAFSFDGQSLRSAVLQESLIQFDGDVVFVWPYFGLISVFHHEGGYFHVQNPYFAARRL